MNWLATNWALIVTVAAFVAFHMLCHLGHGHGGRHGHGSHRPGGDTDQPPPADEQGHPPGH